MSRCFVTLHQQRRRRRRRRRVRRGGMENGRARTEQPPRRQQRWLLACRATDAADLDSIARLLTGAQTAAHSLFRSASRMWPWHITRPIRTKLRNNDNFQRFTGQSNLHGQTPPNVPFCACIRTSDVTKKNFSLFWLDGL